MTTPRQTEQELMQEQVRDGYGNHANNKGDTAPPTSPAGSKP